MMELRSDFEICLTFLLVIMTFGMLTEAQTGDVRFENSVYTVNESPMASVELCVEVDSKFQRFVNVSISTVDGTAMATLDYDPIINFALEFNTGDASQNNCIHINIIDDDIHEPEEHFSVLLIGENSKTPISNATVCIIDDDDEISPTTMPTTETPTTQTTEPPNPMLPPTVEISFLKEVYFTVESDGSVEVCAQASSLSSESITATITLIENTATFMEDFVIPDDGIILRFANSRDLTQCGTINIIDDEEPEQTETFLIALQTVVGNGDNTTVATAVVSIIDDDYLECAEDTYIIMENTTELTVCVVPVLCVQTPGGLPLKNNCAEIIITNQIGTRFDSLEILAEEIDGRSIVKCIAVTFTSSIQPGELINILLINSGNTQATCRVRVIAPSEVPVLYFEHEQYFIREGMPLNLCGFLVDVTNEFEPPEDLTATLYLVSDGNTNANIHVTYTLEKNFITDDGVTVVKYCGFVNIPSNNQPERARNFTIELNSLELNAPGIQPLSGLSGVFVTDDDGPNVECYRVSNSVFEPIDFLTAQRYNCFQDVDLDITLDKIRYCYYNKSETDCTHWTPDSYSDNADNLQPFLQNYLPPLCQDLWPTLFEELYSRPPGVESLAGCNTQCIVSTAVPNDPESCPGSVLLMDAVFAPAVLNISGEMILEECQDIVLQISCCDQPILDECFKAPPSINPPIPQEAIIGSAVGGALVLVLSVLVIILAAILCCRRHNSVERPPEKYYENSSYKMDTGLSEREYEEIDYLQIGTLRVGTVEEAGRQGSGKTGTEPEQGDITETHLLEEGYIYDNEDLITAEPNAAYGAHCSRNGV